MLSENTSLPWSLELIERFVDHWNLERSSAYSALSLNLLKPSDVAEIMAFHFTNSMARIE
jgi:hypothetical protein